MPASAARNAYKYHALSDAEEPSREKGHSPSRNLRVLKFAAAIALLGGLVGLVLVFFGKNPSAKTRYTACDTPEKGFQCKPSLSHSWGQYSPFFSVPSEIDPAIPQGCDLTFVQMLSRHGARDPTSGKSSIYNDTIRRIQESVDSYGRGFGFIEDYEYILGADQLTVLGEQELVNSGVKFYTRYRSLASQSVPFIRSSGQDRVVDSAVNWTQGFHKSRLAENISDETFPYDMVVIPEAAGVNNTLSHRLCPAFESGPYSHVGDDAQEIWLNIFAPPITAKLNANLPGANLTDQDAVYVMDLCPFNTVASAEGRLSRFCALFTEPEWRDYAYYQSLGKWYGFGPGNPLGPTQGVGFANELLARLTGLPVRDRTSTNATLDADPVSFPLGRALYADFSHDNDMMAAFAALGLYNATPPLPRTVRREPAQLAGFAAGWAVPFAGRAYVEKMVCGGGGGSEGTEESEELVRVLVNDRVVPLQGCGADDLGRCTLSSFVQSLSFARAGGYWDQCFV